MIISYPFGIFFYDKILRYCNICNSAFKKDRVYFLMCILQMHFILLDPQSLYFSVFLTWIRSSSVKNYSFIHIYRLPCGVHYL